MYSFNTWQDVYSICWNFQRRTDYFAISVFLPSIYLITAKHDHIEVNILKWSSPPTKTVRYPQAWRRKYDSKTGLIIINPLWIFAVSVIRSQIFCCHFSTHSSLSSTYFNFSLYSIGKIFHKLSFVSRCSYLYSSIFHFLTYLHHIKSSHLFIPWLQWMTSLTKTFLFTSLWFTTLLKCSFTSWHFNNAGRQSPVL